MNTQHSNNLETLAEHPMQQQWWEIIQEVLNSNRRRIMVIGPADANARRWSYQLLANIGVEQAGLSTGALHRLHEQEAEGALAEPWAEAALVATLPAPGSALWGRRAQSPVGSASLAAWQR